VQLTNTEGISTLWGTEGMIMLSLPWYFNMRSTISWTLGQGSDAMPLSRIPPLNGTGELTWKHPQGFTAGGAIRWATSQTQLAEADRVDARIPQGGTPDFVVADLRMSYRTRRAITVSLVFENILNAAYRYHGSSINGPGRGLMFLAEIGPFWR
jgi:iron complex outermembrane receptor protein/hemoglobin/transferrin/lactoferrin receptor protein